MMIKFTPEEIRKFIWFLKKVTKNLYRFPDEKTMRTVHKTISMWAIELVIVHRRQRKKEILLAIYDGGAEKFQGKWHIPGSYNLWPELDVQATCSRLAKRELGIDVRYRKVIDIYKWRSEEHPYGHPLSIYAECLPKEVIAESDKLRFFPIDELPENLLEPHRRFIEKYLR